MSYRDIVDSMDRANKTKESVTFRQAGGVIGEARSQVREQIQEKTAPRVRDLIEKLQDDGALTMEDLELSRLWLIGDAEAYVEIENDYDHWVTEFQRLREVMNTYATKDSCSIEDLVQLQGVLEDAWRVTFDIANFLENEERIASFRETTADPANVNKKVLAAVLARKLASDKT